MQRLVTGGHVCEYMKLYMSGEYMKLYKHAMKLYMSGELKMTGDHSKLEELKRELAPHAETFTKLALQTGHFSTCTPWLPNSAAAHCMNPQCQLPFTIRRRRHHCRGC